MELNRDDVISDTAKMLEDFIYEAYKVALHENIKANTVMISKRLAKVNRFFVNSYGEFPPLICGLEAYVTDELPDEFAFGLVEAPTTKREHYLEEGRKRGYMQAVSKMKERFHNYKRVSRILDQIAKEMLEGNNEQESDEK